MDFCDIGTPALLSRATGGQMFLYNSPAQAELAQFGDDLRRHLLKPKYRDCIFRLRASRGLALQECYMNAENVRSLLGTKVRFPPLSFSLGIPLLHQP